jgi:hypothetical protein
MSDMTEAATPDLSQYKFVGRWPLDTGIEWRDRSRAELNAIIDVYNQWQLDGMPVCSKAAILVRIEYGVQVFSKVDGGSEYVKELREMQNFVRHAREQPSVCDQQPTDGCESSNSAIAYRIASGKVNELQSRLEKAENFVLLLQRQLDIMQQRCGYTFEQMQEIKREASRE